MMPQINNEELRQLLVDLGFVAGQTARNNYRVYQHPESQCEIVVPANRDKAPARQSEVLAVRDHLDCHGHLEAETFDRFLQDGKLPAA